MLRLCVVTFQPIYVLVDLVQYIVNVYIAVLFSMKKHSNFADGVRHFVKVINFSQYMTKRFRNFVNKPLKGNAFFAHSENILIAM